MAIYDKLLDIFKQHCNGNGMIDKDVVVDVMRRNEPWSTEEIEMLLASSGSCVNGSVNYQKLMTWIYQVPENPYVRYLKSNHMPDLSDMDAAYLQEQKVSEVMNGLIRRLLIEKPLSINQFCADYFSGALAAQKRLVLIASNVAHVDVLKAAVKPVGDMGAEIVTATWDYNADPTALTKQIKELTAKHGTFKTVAVCCHGASEATPKDGEKKKKKKKKKWKLTKASGINLKTGKAGEGVHQAIGAMAKAASVRVDLLSCNLAGSKGGRKLVQRWEKETKTNFAASTDLTGNVEQGANWILETDGIDVGSVYFDLDKIKEWKGTLGWFDSVKEVAVEVAVDHAVDHITDTIDNIEFDGGFTSDSGASLDWDSSGVEFEVGGLEMEFEWD